MTHKVNEFKIMFSECLSGELVDSSMFSPQTSECIFLYLPPIVGSVQTKFIIFCLIPPKKSMILMYVMLNSINLHYKTVFICQP